MRGRLLFVAVFGAAAATLTAQVPQKEPVDGVRNFTRVDATVACAGATEPRALAEVARRGYRSVIDLRESGEAGAALDESRAAARAAGLTFISLPFNGSRPDAAVVDAFIKAVTDPANQPAFVHCASGNRAAALWMAKRMVVDRWPQDRAAAEAEAIGLTSKTLRAFVVAYAASRLK
jgi:uncharacterized protein (TIGR01244 family)